MDINNIDSELNIKIKEVFKMVLKKPDISIIFNEIEDNTDILQSISIYDDDHEFILQKLQYKLSNYKINEKYYPFLNKKIKNKINNLSLNDKINEIKKHKYLYIFKPIYGNIILKNNKYYFIYQITYNSITIDLTKYEFDKFIYYVQYVYKLQQILKLNKELNIDQNIKIIFDDDKAAQDMYNDMYNNLNDIIKPFKNDIDNIDEDIDE
jgi:hypothetical protein